MFKVRKFLKSVRESTTVDEFSELLKSVNRPLPKEETLKIYKDLKNNKNVRKNVSIIFNYKCTEKEAYRREFNKPCPHCGNNENMDSIVLDIIEEKGVYKLKMVCSKCGETYITKGNKVRK